MTIPSMATHAAAPKKPAPRAFVFASIRIFSSLPCRLRCQLCAGCGVGVKIAQRELNPRQDVFGKSRRQEQQGRVSHRAEKYAPFAVALNPAHAVVVIGADG